MAKKPVKTFHPLRVIESLKAQNEAVGQLLMAVDTANAMAPSVQDGELRKLITKVQEQAEKVRAVFWPED